MKTVVKDVGLSFGFPRIAYPGAGTTYYYSFHLHYVVAPTATSKGYSTLPPKTKTWIGTNVRTDNAYSDWLAYGHQAPGVVNKVFAAPILLYERVVFTWGPLLAVIFLLGLGGVISVSASAWRRGQGLRAALSFRTLRSVRLHWAPRGTSMLPWVTAVALLVVPIMVADFDYRYLIPVIPFACMAAGLGFAPRRAKPAPAAPVRPVGRDRRVHRPRLGLLISARPDNSKKRARLGDRRGSASDPGASTGDAKSTVRSGQFFKASDRPDIVARVFNLKLKALLHDLLNKHVLGTLCCRGLYDRISETRTSSCAHSIDSEQ